MARDVDLSNTLFLLSNMHAKNKSGILLKAISRHKSSFSNNYNF